VYASEPARVRQDKKAFRGGKLKKKISPKLRDKFKCGGIKAKGVKK